MELSTANPLRRTQRRWLVRIDPEIWIDVDFCGRLSLVARYAYLDSLFFLAAGDGPDSSYPLARLIAETETDANRVCIQLLDFGIWSLAADGFAVRPYNGCRVVPEQRATIPRALRQAVFERDGNRCVKCGATENLSLDHIHPWSLGGPDTYENLRVLCRSCNSSKGASLPGERQSLAEMFAEVEASLNASTRRRTDERPVFLPATRA